MTWQSVRDPVQWRTATRRHDWLDGEVLRILLRGWTQSGLIGRPDRLQSGDEERTWRLGDDEDVAAAVLRTPHLRDGGLWCRLGGAEPRPWSMSVVIAPFEPELGGTFGYSMINLDLPREYCEGVDSTLLKLFEALHRPDRCEYASIHPERHAGELELRAYVPALDVGPLFAGMLWANFLGPGTVEKFSREAIDRLDVARRRWFDGRGVFLAVSEHLTSIDSPEGERKLIALTEELRAAPT